MLRPQTGPPVRKVQQALLDLRYDLGPHRDDGIFGRDTGAAVTLFKTRREIFPNDPVVGPKTMAALDEEFALPFADREEWLSWGTRPLPQWNFTREDELLRRYLETPLTFSQESQWLPAPYQRAILTGLTALLDPFGSPDGPRTPSATWGVSPLDLRHCHVVVNASTSAPAFDVPHARGVSYTERLVRLRERATRMAGSVHTPAWTLAYRQLLLERGTPDSPSVRDEAANVLNLASAASLRNDLPVFLVWHSFEEPNWRPATMKPGNRRRHWWNVVLPVPSGVTHPPFTEFRNRVVEILELTFLISAAGVITIMAETIIETAAVVGLPVEDVSAAISGRSAPVVR